jgi:c-di-GMP-binding flagellar brake protein YcgR
MTIDGKRKDPRIPSSNLISYMVRDQNDQGIMQGMGRTLNVSEGGILLETHIPLDPHHVVTLTIALEDELIEFKDRIAHSTKREDGGFTSGITFMEMNEEKRRYLRQYCTLFKGQEPML